MKIHLWALLALASLYSCQPAPKNPAPDSGKIIFTPADQQILEQVLDLCSAGQEATLADLMIKVGRFFLGTPYVAHTLEKEEEQLLINLREMDCTTYAENCLAISRTIRSGKPSFEQFTAELQGIRYRDGILDGYPSRLHYFCDWIYNNQQKKLIEDISEEIAQTPFPKEINFMSSHPDSYVQLKEDARMAEVMAEQEKEISARELFYIPESNLPEVESRLMDGDIAGITTSIDGIAIQHVVLLIRTDGRIHMMHASSLAGKVVISESTLEEYLRSINSATGIMVARPL
ncbi:MAG: DUF1460 domain-containing protein [Bacteroidales bacterium]|nr:DUF1460 domain-containing protein [Bacteroidales bacterium]